MKILIEVEIEETATLTYFGEMPKGDFYDGEVWHFTIKDTKVVATDRAYVVLPECQWIAKIGENN